MVYVPKLMKALMTLFLLIPSLSWGKLEGKKITFIIVFFLSDVPDALRYAVYPPDFSNVVPSIIIIRLSLL